MAIELTHNQIEPSLERHDARRVQQRRTKRGDIAALKLECNADAGFARARRGLAPQ
jgi:hypothetical protein